MPNALHLLLKGPCLWAKGKAARSRFRRPRSTWGPFAPDADPQAEKPACVTPCTPEAVPGPSLAFGTASLGNQLPPKRVQTKW